MRVGASAAQITYLPGLDCINSVTLGPFLWFLTNCLHLWEYSMELLTCITVAPSNFIFSLEQKKPNYKQPKATNLQTIFKPTNSKLADN